MACILRSGVVLILMFAITSSTLVVITALMVKTLIENYLTFNDGFSSHTNFQPDIVISGKPYKLYSICTKTNTPEQFLHCGCFAWMHAVHV